MGIIVPIQMANLVFKFQLTGDPDPMICTLGVQPAILAPVEDVAIEAYAAAADAGGPWAAGSMYTGYTFVSCTAYLQTIDGFVVSEYGENIAGTASGATLPQNCSLLVTKLTNAGGRRNKGRMYVPPLSMTETNVSNIGAITGTAAIQTGFNTFFTRLVAAPAIVGPMLFHSDGGPATAITGFRVESLLATQRRRLRR